MQESHFTSGFQSSFVLLKLIKSIVLQLGDYTTVYLIKQTRKNQVAVASEAKSGFCCVENVSCDDCRTALIFMLYLEFKYLNSWQFLFFVGDK